jgi:hypothetical protein
MMALSVTWTLSLVALLVTIVIVVAGCDNHRHKKTHTLRASPSNNINRNGNNGYLRGIDLGRCRNYHPMRRQGHRYGGQFPMGTDDKQT